MVAESNKLGMYPVQITATIPNPLPRPIEESEPANITVEPLENIDTDE